MHIFSILTALFSVFFVLTVIILWVALPFLIEYKVKSNVNLGNKTQAREMWTKVPFPVDFKIYLFNITNPEEFMNGAKPTVEEIGPYVYDEWKEKTIVSENEKEDTIDFYMKNTFIFQKDKSNGLTGEEMIVMPHPLIVLGSLTLSADKKEGLLPGFYDALKALFGNLTDPFVRTTARQILFDGFDIDCNTKDFKAKQICRKLQTELPTDAHGIVKFSFMGTKNGTDLPGLFKVKRGVLMYQQVGKVVEFNGKKKLNVWPETGSCNEIRGTDSTIFSPFQTKDDDIFAFAPDICTSMASKFQMKSTFKNVTTGYYTASLGDMSTDPEMKCYCPTEDTCMKKGAFDLKKCVNTTLVITLPHFYDTDVSYLEGVNGLSPNKDLHQIFMHFEMTTGSPIFAAKRIQFNVPIKPLAKMPVMRNISQALLPIFWVEESITLNDTFIDAFKSLQHFMRLSGVVKWSATAIFGFGLLFSIIMMFVVEVINFDENRYLSQNTPSMSSGRTTPSRNASAN